VFTDKKNELYPDSNRYSIIFGFSASDTIGPKRILTFISMRKH